MSKRPVTQSNAVFATADIGKIQRSTFIRPSSLKTSFNCGKLVPVYVDEVLPGDTFKMDMKFLSRLTTPVFPTMDDITLEFYAFFVPNRLVWENWEELCGENKTGSWVPITPPALVPNFYGTVVGSDIIQSKKLGDYYGLPVGMDLYDCHVSSLPFRGYALIWNEWFRDENLQSPIPITFGSYSDNNIVGFNPAYSPNSDLFPVNKFHDYFTSALPSPQRGSSPLIPIQLNQLIPVITGTDISGGSSTELRFNTVGTSTINSGTSAALRVYNDSPSATGSMLRTGWDSLSGLSNVSDIKKVYPSNLWADARNITGLNDTTIAQLRTLFQIQKLFERDARGGKLKNLCLHVKKIAEKIWKALVELIRGEGLCQPQRIASEII